MTFAHRAHRAHLLTSAGLLALSLAATPVWAGAVQAPTAINFTGLLANGGPSTSDSPDTHFDFWGLNLEPFTSFTVSLNQRFVATVSLDGAYTLPTSVGGRFIRLFLQGPDLDSTGSTGTQGDLDLFLGNTPVASFPGQGCGTSTAVAACSGLAAPHDTPLTFDRAVFSFTIDTLDRTRTASVAVFDTVLTAPVPEAQTWALLTAGLALLAALGRRQPLASKASTGTLGCASSHCR